MCKTFILFSFLFCFSPRSFALLFLHYLLLHFKLENMMFSSSRSNRKRIASVGRWWCAHTKYIMLWFKHLSLGGSQKMLTKHDAPYRISGYFYMTMISYDTSREFHIFHLFFSIAVVDDDWLEFDDTSEKMKFCFFLLKNMFKESKHSMDEIWKSKK